jgi:hypothetical protein
VGSALFHLRRRRALRWGPRFSSSSATSVEVCGHSPEPRGVDARRSFVRIREALYRHRQRDASARGSFGVTRQNRVGSTPIEALSAPRKPSIALDAATRLRVVPSGSQARTAWGRHGWRHRPHPGSPLSPSTARHVCDMFASPTARSLSRSALFHFRRRRALRRVGPRFFIFVDSES